MTRSRSFFNQAGVAGLTHRAFTGMMGFDSADMARPLIGICNTFSELNPCNSHLRQLAEAVKRGVLQAGGTPLEFPTISLGEIHLSPTSMLYRNLAAMDTEEMIRGNPLDGVVMLSNCDKTTPAALMGAASADIPAIMLSGGPMLNGHYMGEILGACTDCRRYTAEFQAGEISAETYAEVERNLVRSAGHCMVMGTASTMNSLMEALGHGAAGQWRHPRGRFAALASGGRGRAANCRAGGAGYPSVADSHASGIRQCHHAAACPRRQHQCHRTSAGHRGARWRRSCRWLVLTS